MLRYLLANSELSTLLRFVSPRFFKVASPKDIASVAAAIRASAKDAAALEALATDNAWMAASVSGTLPEQVLELYFRQVATRARWSLDFRASAFEPLHWTPAEYFYDFDPPFLNGVRALYRGFYGTDDLTFRAGLKALGLESAEAALRRQFGEGDQTAVRFSLATFQRNFADVFEACATAGVKLQPGFFVLGMALLSLYEHLEGLGGTYDVRACFERGFKGPE